MLNIAQNLPECDALLSYWRGACQQGQIPDVTNLSPVRLRRWVGDISVIHIHEGPKKYFVSLHGANVARHIGPAFHKQYLEDAIPAASLPYALALYDECIKRRAPMYAIMVPTLDNGLHTRLERMALPFRDADSDAVERILVWVAPNDRKLDTLSSVYDDAANNGDSGPVLALYSLAGEMPERLAVPAAARARDVSAVTRGWRRLRSKF